MAKAAMMAGVHGIMVEVHPEPEKALSDGPQSMTIPGFERLMEEIKKLKIFLGYPGR
jgi:3-deoxy-7-phosphoheptulonate synthase